MSTIFIVLTLFVLIPIVMGHIIHRGGIDLVERRTDLQRRTRPRNVFWDRRQRLIWL
jgi:hypothetical protein